MAALATLLLAAALAAQAAPPPATPASAAPVEPPAERLLALSKARLGILEQQLGAAQAELARLRPMSASIGQCTAKNARLMQLANEILARHEARFGKRRMSPFQLARTRLENEAQAFGDEIYDSRIDVPVRRAAEAAPATPSEPVTKPTPE